MSGRIAFAVGVVVVFGALAVAMSRSLISDYREAGRQNDSAWFLFGLDGAKAVLISAFVAIAGPIVILVMG